jgi:hypothetical protein
MGEHYKTFYIPECDRCDYEATYEVCDESGRVLGHFCEEHADAELERLNGSTGPR